MDLDIDEAINNLGGKISILQSVVRALLACVCGTEELSDKDTQSFVYILENQIQDLSEQHSNIVDMLDI